MHTIEQALNVTKSLTKTYDCIVLQLITNDIRHHSVDEVICMLEQLIGVCKSKSQEQIISLAPERLDSSDLNYAVKWVNDAIRVRFKDHESVFTCSHDNLCHQGQPNQSLYMYDKFHLTKQGSGRMYANIKNVVRECIHRRRQQQQSIYQPNRSATELDNMGSQRRANPVYHGLKTSQIQNIPPRMLSNTFCSY